MPFFCGFRLRGDCLHWGGPGWEATFHKVCEALQQLQQLRDGVGGVVIGGGSLTYAVTSSTTTTDERRDAFDSRKTNKSDSVHSVFAAQGNNCSHCNDDE
jgi:hypothetical protein